MLRRAFASCLWGVASAGIATGTRAAPGGVLRFALGQSWGKPFLERDGSKVKGGLLPEVMTGIAQEMGLKPQMLLLPAARSERALEDGSVDLQCLLSPTWWTPLPAHLSWSVPVMVLRDVLVAAPDGPANAAALQTDGPWTVSTVRGYAYPTLAAAFGDQPWQRDDGPDQWGALEKVRRSRTHLAVVKELTLLAHNRQHGGVPLRMLQVVEAATVHCVVSDRSRVPPAQIKAAIERWVARGGPKRVLDHYR